MKAVVFAAGEGSRLRPLTATRPTTMLPVGNRPILDYVISTLAAADIREIVLVVGQHSEEIERYCGDGDRWGVDLTYVTQSPQRGTGHALLQAEPHLEDAFIALYGDRILEGSLLEDVRWRREDSGEPVMAVTNPAGPTPRRAVELDDDRITALAEEPPVAPDASTLVTAGVYGFGPEIFAALRDVDTPGELSLTTVLAERLPEQPIQAIRYTGRWLDVSTPWDLLAVNDSIIEQTNPRHAASARIDPSAAVAEASVIGANASIQPNATILPGTAIGENVRVGSNCVLENTIVLPDTTLKPGVMLTDCIVGANTTIGTGTVADGGPTTLTLNDTRYADVLFGGLIGDTTTLGANVTITPGTIIGNDTTVASGATLTDHAAVTPQD